MTSRSFSLAVIAATFVLVGCVAAFNWAVDPYWYFRTFDIVGFNHVRRDAEANERLVKPALVTRLRPQAVILGNSVAAIGLPPSNAGFTHNGAMTSYNLAVALGSSRDKEARMLIRLSDEHIVLDIVSTQRGVADYRDNLRAGLADTVKLAREKCEIVRVARDRSQGKLVRRVH